MSVRVIALGQVLAGDDGVGKAVLDELRRRDVPPDVELVQARDATAFFSLLDTPAAVIIVDAAVGADPGQVVVLSADQLQTSAVQPMSSHGLPLPAAIALVRELEAGPPSITVVAITIEPPRVFREELSAAAAGAVVPAADRIVELAGRAISATPPAHRARGAAARGPRTASR